MTEVMYQDTDNQILPRTAADERAEKQVDAISQERFDEFAAIPQPDFLESHPVIKKAAQAGVLVTHTLDAVGSGSKVYLSAEERDRRNNERQKVGLSKR